MPWTAETFQSHHNHHLGIAHAAHAAEVANAILRRTGDEGLAIRTANAHEKRRDDGGDVPDMTQQYNTPLSPDEENQYQAWARNTGRANDDFDYDLRGAWKSGAATSSNGHLPDTFKKPNHPTFSDQSQYHGVDGNQGGSWTQLPGDRWRFTPSSTNLKMTGPQNLQRYFQEREQGNELAMPHEASGGIVHRDMGGIVDPTQSGIGGIAPSPQAMSPMTQGMIQRYASLPPEKLQELGSMLGNSPQGQIVQRLLQQKRAMPNRAQPQQAVAPAPTTARRGGPIQGRAGGGPMGISMSMADPSWTRAEARSDQGSSGFLAGSTPGRADAVHTAAPGGSYILPADVVAGLGEGNGLAGAKVVDMMLRTGPHGIPQAQAHGGHGPPAPPRPMAMQAKGGGVQGTQPAKPSPVALSHGEYIIMPEHVLRIGGGDLKHGHRVLDAWVQLERKRQIEKLKKLPPPVGAKRAA